jgi:hypothetical protein
MRACTHYGGRLTLGTSPDGLYLAMLFLFRVGHPPLFIPGDQVTVTTGRVLAFRFVRFQLGTDDPIPLSIIESLGMKLKREAGHAWPPESLEKAVK